MSEFEVGGMRPEEVPVVAGMHHDFFGTGEMHGTSIANLGRDFLEEVFYRLNLDNPYFFVDVARYQGEIIAFSVYTSDDRKVFRYTLRRHFSAIVRALLKLAVRRPFVLASHMVGNLRFLTDTKPKPVRKIRAWYLL